MPEQKRRRRKPENLVHFRTRIELCALQASYGLVDEQAPRDAAVAEEFAMAQMHCTVLEPKAQANRDIFVSLIARDDDGQPVVFPDGELTSIGQFGWGRRRSAAIWAPASYLISVLAPLAAGHLSRLSFSVRPPLTGIRPVVHMHLTTENQDELWGRMDVQGEANEGALRH